MKYIAEIPSSRWAGVSWTAILFFVVILLFGIVLIGHAPKWPIYASILVWWAFVIYTTIHVNHQKDEQCVRPKR